MVNLTGILNKLIPWQFPHHAYLLFSCIFDYSYFCLIPGTSLSLLANLYIRCIQSIADSFHFQYIIRHAISLMVSHTSDFQLLLQLSFSQYHSAHTPYSHPPTYSRIILLLPFSCFPCTFHLIFYQVMKACMKDVVWEVMQME